MAEKQDNDKFDEYLTGQSPLSKLYQQASEVQEPSEEIDTAILRAAQKAIEDSKTDSPTHSTLSWRQWLVPISIAAVLLLSISVVLKFDTHDIEQESDQLAVLSESSDQKISSAPSAPAEAESKKIEQQANQQLVEGKAESTTVYSSGKPVDIEVQQQFKDPESWLDYIADLIKQEETVRAMQALQNFRKRYPDYKLEKYPQVRQLEDNMPQQPPR